MTHASLFSGIGGSEIAATQMGWSNLFHCEINPFGRRVLEYWYPNSTSYEDITQTDFTPWRGRVDVLTGGFPCQPFSLAGQRRGADDDRYLWPQMLRAIREIRPSWVVGENVAGILTMVQSGTEVEVGGGASFFGEDYRKRVLLRQQFTVETICASLEREGYSVQPFVIPACAVGAPHRRDRVWFIARRVAPNATGHGNSGRPGQLCTQDGRPQERVYAQPVKHGGVPSGPDSHPDLNSVGGKDKILVSPIIHWTERDVWEFLNSNGIPHCELYDQGHTRIGCILCPMSNYRQKVKYIERWPHVKRNWIKTIQWLKDNGYSPYAEESAETNFRWWISGKSYAKFYADEFQQQKINFEQ